MSSEKDVCKPFDQLTLEVRFVFASLGFEVNTFTKLSFFSMFRDYSASGCKVVETSYNQGSYRVFPLLLMILSLLPQSNARYMMIGVNIGVYNNSGLVAYILN